jgi:hypothetical protein
MDRFDDDTLFAELRELRPTPRPEFTAELDQRAAAGFPRGERTSAAAMPFALLADWWRKLSGRGRLIPVLGTAFAVLAVATVVVAVTQSGGGSSNTFLESAPSISSDAEGGGSEGGGGAEATESESAGGEEAAEGSGSESSAAQPRAMEAEGESGAIESEPAEEAAGAEEVEGTIHGPSAALPAVPAEKAAKGEFEGNFFDEGSPAKTRGQREIERSAYVVLGTKPGEVANAAAQVYTAVHAAKGVVLHSKVQSGSHGATGAYFELLIPSRKLDDALSSFSQIAEVRERHDATNDITAPTVGASEELRDSNASIEGLLKELGDVETEEERESVEARLREERRRHASIRASLDHLHKRASMSEVTVRIVTDRAAGMAPPSKDEGGWGVGDALHDAGHILTIAAAVALIGLAILGPIALILLTIWLGNRFRVRRLRERALG